MSATLTAPPPSLSPARSPGDALVPLPITVDEFHLMADAGVYAADPYESRIELLDGYAVHAILGDSVERPTMMNPRHVRPIQKLVRLVPQFDGTDCTLRVQLPVTLPQFNEPQPDAAIARGSDDDYAARHPGPGDLLALIEVSDASTFRDRGVKLRAYAAAGVPLYVILHVPTRTVELYTEPQPAQGRYGRSETLAADATLHLPTAAGAAVSRPRTVGGGGTPPVARTTCAATPGRPWSATRAAAWRCRRSSSITTSLRSSSWTRWCLLGTGRASPANRSGRSFGSCRRATASRAGRRGGRRASSTHSFRTPLSAKP